MDISPSSLSSPQRLAKVIAHSGLCSRREAERLILSGSVLVDGVRIQTPATNVLSSQYITVNNIPLKPYTHLQLYKFYKPRAILTTRHDPQGRRTIYDCLPGSLSNLIYVGRLDYHSEGLLLLTNNGEISRLLAHPSTGLPRTYRVRAHGKFDPSALKHLSYGTIISGIHYAPFQVEIIQEGTSNHWISITLTEGKNREIRILLDSIGLTVNRLIRTHYGPISLGTLTPGQVKRVENPEWILNHASPVLNPPSS